MPRQTQRILGVLAVLVLFPAIANAQILGVGPRFSFVRGDMVAATPSTKLFGGSVRLKISPRMSVEGSLDYRTYRNAAKTERVQETPIQGSLLFFPLRTAFAPYAAGGLGIYTQKADSLNAAGTVLNSEISRKLGWHAGFGAELKVARHVTLFGDYRYRFVSFGRNDEGTASLIPGLDKFKVSHQGSMWTGGFAFYF